MTDGPIPLPIRIARRLEDARRHTVAGLDAALAARYPAFLRLWRRPAPRTTLILAALVLVIALQPHTHLEWKFSHVLWDYRFGLIKRGLVGEVFARLFDTVSIDRFFWTFGALLLVLAGLMALTVAALPVTASPVVLLYLCATPMLLRNLVYDWGRFDVLGLIAVWLIALALVRDWPGRFWLYALVPLVAFVHEGDLVIVAPFALMAILLFERPAGGRWWLSALALAVTATAGAVVLQLYGRLDVPPETMLAHMASKTADRFEQPIEILTSSLTDNLRERLGFVVDKVVSLKFAAKLAVVLVLFRWLLPSGLRRGPVLLAMLAIAAGFLPLYPLGTDSFRWLALQANAAFALLVVAVARYGITRLPRDRVYLVALSVAVPPLGI